MSELVSVILPVYNSERSIEVAVSSVLNQTFPNIELIIVNDASSDRTKEICESLAAKDSRIVFVSNEKNLGTLETRHKGISMAKGEWIAFIDADDLWQTDKLEKQIALQKATGCDLVYTASAFIDDDGKLYDWIMHVPAEVEYKKLLRQNVIPNSSVFMRKNDFVKYSPPEEREHDMHEDFACWLCMLRAGLKARGIDEPLLTYRISKKSSTSNKMKASVLNMNTYKYVGLGFFERNFYQMCYAFNGIKKYLHFK